MDEEKPISGRLPPQAEGCLFRSGTTPPDRQPQLPPTPPAAEERLGRHVLPRHDVDRRLREYKRKAEEGDVPPFAEFPLEPRYYRPQPIERLVNRHDYDAKHGKLFVRTPSTIHEYFSFHVVEILKDQLRDIGGREGPDGEFASKITSVGSARIFLKESDEADSKTMRRQPDGQFQHIDSIYPGIVLEVSYSQDGKNLRKLAEDYILCSGGKIKAVLGFYINPLGKESTVSLWRAKFTWLEDEDMYSLEADPEVSKMPFRQTDGSPANPDECLALHLSDFFNDKVSDEGVGSALLSLRLDHLSGLLADAEQLQKKRETAYTGKPRRPLKRMRLPSSSPEELRFEDEAKFVDRESCR